MIRGVLAEYEDVIRRPRFTRDATVIERTLQATHADACSDPGDNMFLECAEAAHADYLATGNQRHFLSSGRRRG
jgi:predicted nucleic acid-binding protein